MGSQRETMRTVLLLFLAGVAAARGFDCQMADKASTTTCQAFGMDSHPCQLVKLHQNANCGQEGTDLGETMLEVSESHPHPKQGLLTALKEEEKAASKGDVMETIRLASQVYDKATQMCKDAKHPLFTKPNEAPKKEAEKKEPEKKEPEKKEPEKKEPAAEKKEPEKKEEKVDFRQKFAVKADVAEKERKEAEKKADFAQKFPVYSDELEKEGVPAADAKKLPLDAAKGLQKEIAKKENKSLEDPITKKPKIAKKSDALEMRQKIEALKREDAIKIQEAGSQAAAEGKDAQAVMKKMKAESDKKIAQMEAEIPGSEYDSVEEQKVANDELKRKQKVVEKENVKNMMGSLPAGKGLKTAFLKIEKSKLDAVKVAQEQKVAREAAKMEEKKSEGAMNALTEEGQKLLLKEKKKAAQNAEDMKNPQKMVEENKALKAEEKKIQEENPPGQSNDSQMYGNKDEAAKLEDPKKVDKSKLAKADADAKKTAAAEAAGGAEVTMLE